MRERDPFDRLAKSLITGEVTVEKLALDHHPADVADILERLGDPEKIVATFHSLDHGVASEILSHFNDTTRSLVLDNSHPEIIARLVGEMDSDDATDIIAEVDDDLASRILDAVPENVGEEVSRLLEFGEETAGGIMQTELFTARRDETVGAVITELRHRAEELGDIHNIFVVDENERLTGVVSLRTLIMNKAHERLDELVEEEPVSVSFSTDQEAVAELFKRYDLVSLPVVDDHLKLLGRIMIDDIVDVLEDEASEDIIKMAGADDEALDRSHSVTEMARYRLPWLGSSLLGGFLTGLIIWSFRDTMNDNLALASFIPIVMGMSGNVGSQSSALMIRGLATGAIHRGALGNYIKKELGIGLLLGLVCGVAAGTIAQIWHGSYMLGLVVALSLSISLLFAALVGALIPFLFRTFDIDPAIAGGPMVLALNDLSGVLIFFAAASMLLTAL